ncbi:MAG: hypothetical protein V1778_03285 [bacterium]
MARNLFSMLVGCAIALVALATPWTANADDATTARSIADSSSANVPTVADRALKVVVDLRPLDWKNLNRNPAGIPLDQQIQYFPLPDAVKLQMIEQSRTITPDKVWIISTKDHPVYVDILTFGGRLNNVFTVRGRTKIDLRDSTGAHIDSVQALEWLTITHENVEYTLLQFVVCTNGAFVSCARMPKQQQPAPPSIGSVTPPVSTPPPPQQAERAPERQSPIEIPFEEAEGAVIVYNGTGWLTPEYVDVDKGGNHGNGSVGAEVIVRKSYGNHNLGLVGRIAAGATEFTDASVMPRSGAIEGRLGIRRPLIPHWDWGIDVEAGGFASRERLIFRHTEEAITPGLLYWQDFARYVNGGGGYLRTVGYGPQFLDWDIRYLRGERVQQAVEAEASVSPLPLYLAGSFQRTDRTKHDVGEFRGQVYAAPSSKMKMAAVQVGIRPYLNHILSVGWKHRKYQSPTWNLDWEGPMAEYTWQKNNNVRFRFNYTKFTKTDEENPRTGQHFTNDHTRITSGVIYDF